MATIDTLRLAAMNRHRIRLFGDGVSLIVYTMTPAAGETAAGTFTQDWFGQRVAPTTNDQQQRDASEWQFQIKANADWATSQAFMMKGVSLTVAGQRWKISKVEKPIGVSLVWKVRAQEQK